MTSTDKLAPARSFGHVFHYLWLETTADIDRPAYGKAAVSKATQILASLGAPKEPLIAMIPLAGIGSFHHLLWLERYADITEWAAVELAAQRSKPWMETVCTLERDQKVEVVESNVLIDDSTDPAPRCDADQLTVDWAQFEPTKLDAITRLPDLIDELASHVRTAGFVDAAVRFLAMTTTSGEHQNRGHLWIESPSPDYAIALSDWRHRSVELADWRRRFQAIARVVRDHSLLTRCS
ncbi:hypothetical protein M2272_002705 [Mycobacterium frederiksbergense]|uniref:Uncharacterized protein n=1 Tax=Mycolicibacterium frederiksbergense TaxID=117567 RepID=A0ABT6KZF1_9MYCO|nr:hypothetical protein [Mycolicibacterium frederiksbergense]MDH6196065.1 hypothetical protein [Mycolicibacterium frederiksbergense]